MTSTTPERKGVVSGDLFQADDLPLVEAFDRDPDPCGGVLREPDDSVPAGGENIVFCSSNVLKMELLELELVMVSRVAK